MSTNKWVQKLLKLEGAIVDNVNPFNDVIESPSPSINSIFGNTWGLPRGYTAVFYGPPKEGKSVLAHLMIGKLHQDDPEALAVKFDTEFRTQGQLTEESAKIFGIDFNRLVRYEVNTPELVFDRIEGEIAAQCQDGAPFKLIIIDSLYGIQGRRAMNADSVGKQIIGDHAQTIQDGLKRILPIQRKYNLGLILIDQVRSEMDPIEQMRNNKFKMRSAFGVQHHAEYFIAIEENKTVEGRKDLHGKEFVNESVADITGRGEKTGMKIKVRMRNSSMGPKNRTGEFTLDFKKGVINVHEEIFKLGVGYGVIQRPNNMTYVFGEKTWKGKDSFLQALQESPAMQNEIIQELKKRDQAGQFSESSTVDITEESP